MSSNNKQENDGGSGSQPSRNNGSTSSGVGGLFGNILSRASPTKRSQPFPQLEVERDEATTQGDGEWEDIPEPSTRTAPTPKSIMHMPTSPSRENRVSFEGDRKMNSEGRRDRSVTGSARSGRGIGEFVSTKLHESTRGRGSASTVTANRRPTPPNISPSPTRRGPMPTNTHPLATSHNSPPHEDHTFLNPGNAPFGVGDFDASRPLTPDEAWGDAEREALRTGTGDGDTVRAVPDARAVPPVTGFEIESLPPFELDPHSPLAEQDPNFVPIRTIAGRLQGRNGNGSPHSANHGTPPRLPANARGSPPQQAAAGRDFPMGIAGLLKPDANVDAENAARRRGAAGGTVPRGSGRPQTHLEREILPAGTRRPGATSGHGPTRNPAHGGRHRPGQSGERERRERQRQRKLGAEPYRPLDPYAYPVGQKKSPIPPFLAAIRWAVDWAENNLGLAEEEGTGEDAESVNGRPGRPSQEGESIPMTGRRPAWMRRPLRSTRPAGDRPSAGVPLNETDAKRMARKRGERNAQLLQQEIQEREARLAIEAAERGHHRHLTNEEIREELERGLPVVPRTSPTRRNPRHVAGTPSPLTRPAVEPHPGAVESTPAVTRPSPSPAAPRVEPARRPGQAESSGSGSGRPTPEKNPAVPEKPKAGGTLSPPKASPGYHPVSDPGSPVKPTSPFDLGGALRGISKADLRPIIQEAEKQVELTLREWVRFAFVQAYRHLLLRMPSLYFNRVDRVFTEAAFSKLELSILLQRANQGGPNSVPARVLDHRSPWRGYGGLARADRDENDPLLSDGRDSNSPSPNRRPLPLEVEDNSDLEAGSAFGGGSTLAGAAPAQMDPVLKKSLENLEQFRIEWESFIDGMVKEWKTLNVVSALLLSALLTVFQIQEAAYVPVTRTAALLSLVSAFMSLLFGGVYIIRFSTMRTMRKAARWVEDTHKKEQKILWNIWILLSMPVTWLVYSLIFFCIAIVGFVWTSGTGVHVSPPSDDDNAAIILGPRIGITFLFFIGFIYFCLVLNTFRVWSGVTLSSNNDTLVNLQSPDMRDTDSRLDPNAMAGGPGDRADGQSPPGMHKEINEPNVLAPPRRPEGGGGLDGMQALASQNIPWETREERNEEIARGLGGRTARSVDNAPSMLGLDLTPPVESRPAVFRHSPDVLFPTLTSTPPRLIASGAPASSTIITQPTPITQAPTSTFVTDTSSSAPLTAVDPLMDPSGSLGLQDPISVNSPPFTRHMQALDLDDGLPDRRTPPSTLTSEYATPMAESVSEFGTLNQGVLRMGRGR